MVEVQKDVGIVNVSWTHLKVLASKLIELIDMETSVSVSSPVQVLPVNDQPPQLGGSLQRELRVEEGGRVQVTVDYLWATDGDSDDSTLTYLLAQSPGEGVVQRDGVMVDRFSQQDLQQGLVFYVHTGETAEEEPDQVEPSPGPGGVCVSGGEVGPEPAHDTVTVIISDAEAGGTHSCCHGDTPPPPVPLHGSLPVYDLNVTILPVNNHVPSVVLGNFILV